MEPSIDAAKAGVTTGEWADALREVFGEFRHRPASGARSTGGDYLGDGCGARARCSGGRSGWVWPSCACSLQSRASTGTATRPSRSPCGRATPASKSSIRASGSRPQQIARAAADEDVHVIGISILSGAHGLLVPEVIDRLRAEGVDLDRSR